MKNYEVITKARDRENEVFNVKAKNGVMALKECYNQCVKEDNTGVFFELENANIEELKKTKNLYTVFDEVLGVTYGVILESIREI